MTIFTTLGNTAPQNLSTLAVKLDTRSLTIPEVRALPDFCFCSFQCDYEEKVFGKSGGDDYEQDFSSFLYKLLDSSDSAVIKLLKNGVEVATIVDNTYGVYKPVGSIGTSAEQLLYVGFVADWTKILLAFGGGRYQVTADLTIFGNTLPIESRYFRLFAFDEENADGTVKIRSVQNGNILSSEFDLTGLNWQWALRINGRFGNRTPSLEVDQYQDSARNLKQIQDEITNGYELQTELIPSEVYNLLVYDMTLGNEVYLTDYNLFNPLIWLEIPVYTDDFGDSQEWIGQQRRRLMINFTDKQRNIIKRNG